MSSPAYNFGIDESKPGYGLKPEPPWDSNSKYIIYRGHPTASIDSESLFRKLADEWARETGHLSLVASRLRHPAYLRILNMGEHVVVPLILKEIEQNPDHWFHALVTLTGENPVPVGFTGTVDDAIDLWIEWGRENREKYAAS